MKWQKLWQMKWWSHPIMEGHNPNCQDIIPTVNLEGTNADMETLFTSWRPMSLRKLLIYPCRTEMGLNWLVAPEHPTKSPTSLPNFSQYFEKICSSRHCRVGSMNLDRMKQKYILSQSWVYYAVKIFHTFFSKLALEEDMELVHGKVLTAVNLKKRNIYGPSRRALCEPAEEDIPHPFRKLSYALEVWKHALYALVCLVCNRKHRLILNAKSSCQNIGHSNHSETIIALFSTFSCFHSSKGSRQ